MELEKTSLSHVPALFKAISWSPGINLDIGGGKYNKGTDYLREREVINLVYDPFARDPAHNKKILAQLSGCKADTVTLSNVLCVIKEAGDRMAALLLAHMALAPGGKVYISIYSGDKSGVGKETSIGTWQNNRGLKTYLEEIQKVFPNAKIHKNKYIIGSK